mmetsp:Transcript_74011/g.217182  ORF Transcript_74011/g.217182 Transcript_74011/m.217182 type:complete len:261 (-) Transcript_74011:153-935(-)
MIPSSVARRRQLLGARASAANRCRGCWRERRCSCARRLEAPPAPTLSSWRLPRTGLPAAGMTPGMWTLRRWWPTHRQRNHTRRSLQEGTAGKRMAGTWTWTTCRRSRRRRRGRPMMLREMALQVLVSYRRRPGHCRPCLRAWSCRPADWGCSEGCTRRPPVDHHARSPGPTSGKPTRLPSWAWHDAWLLNNVCQHWRISSTSSATRYCHTGPRCWMLCQKQCRSRRFSGSCQRSRAQRRTLSSELKVVAWSGTCDACSAL